MNENKTKLAVKIIGDQFGDIVQVNFDYVPLRK